MPTYDYKCPKCSGVEEVTHSIKESPEIECPVCSGSGERVVMERLISFNAAGFIFKQWTEAKHYSFKQQKEKNNKELKVKQIDKYGTGARLQPNVAGMEVDSWSDAKKLAKEIKADTSTYDSYIQKEKTTSKISGINDSTWKQAKSEL